MQTPQQQTHTDGEEKSGNTNWKSVGCEFLPGFWCRPNSMCMCFVFDVSISRFNIAPFFSTNVSALGLEHEEFPHRCQGRVSYLFGACFWPTKCTTKHHEFHPVKIHQTWSDTPTSWNVWGASTFCNNGNIWAKTPKHGQSRSVKGQSLMFSYSPGQIRVPSFIPTAAKTMCFSLGRVQRFSVKHFHN